jgi:hypothetical protein
VVEQPSEGAAIAGSESQCARCNLRQYFPKSTDLSFHGPGILENVAAELNRRPRERHGYRTPAEVLAEPISNPTKQTGVADTT